MNSVKHNSFEDYLESVLKKRREKNSRYSLRRFAQDLKVEPSYLSKILSGKRRITPSLIERLGRRLGLQADSVQLYVMQQVKSGSTRHRPTRVQSVQFKKIEFSSAVNLAGWLDFALLEIATIPRLKLTARSAAPLLAVSEPEVQVTLDRLCAMDLLAFNGESYRAVEKNHTIASNPYSTAELRRIQHQYLEKASESLEKDPLEMRDHTGLTLALRADRLPEAKLLIKKFRRSFMKLMEKDPPHDHIYQLIVCLFPLSKDLRKIQS